MQIDKETVLNLLRQQGKDQEAEQAGRELPDTVDTDQHSDLLARFGIDPQDLIGGIAGGRGIPGL